MSPIWKRALVAFVMGIVVSSPAHAGDLPGGMKLNTFVRPKKSSSTHDRAFEYVQKVPDFSLFDGRTKISPSGVGYICLLEQAQGDQLLVTISKPGPARLGTGRVPGSSQSRRPSFLTPNRSEPKRCLRILDARSGPVRERRSRSCLCRRERVLRLDPKHVAALVDALTYGNAAIDSIWLLRT